MPERHNWQPYNPTWLVALARDQRPTEPWLSEALQRCTLARVDRFNIYFVDNSFANESGSAWQFETNIILEDPIEGDIVIDVLKGKRIGGIEFLTRASREGVE